MAIRCFTVLILLTVTMRCLAFEVGQKVLFKMYGDIMLGTVSEIHEKQYFINEPKEHTNYAKNKVFSRRNIQPYTPVTEYQETKTLIFGRNETWSIGDEVMINWNGGLQKATIRDLTSDGLVYFSSVNGDSFALGNQYFPISIIRNRYTPLNDIEFDGDTFKLGDRVLLYDKFNVLYDNQDLYSGKIIDINADGEIRIDYLHKRNRFYSINDIQHLISVQRLNYKGKIYSVEQQVVVRWNGGLLRTRILDLTSSGYVLVEEFRIRNGYIKIDKLID